MLIAERMRHAGGYVETFVGIQNVSSASHFQTCSAVENVEKLLCPVVQMADFR